MSLMCAGEPDQHWPRHMGMQYQITLCKPIQSSYHYITTRWPSLRLRINIDSHLHVHVPCTTKCLEQAQNTAYICYYTTNASMGKGTYCTLYVRTKFSSLVQTLLSAGRIAEPRVYYRGANVHNYGMCIQLTFRYKGTFCQVTYSRLQHLYRTQKNSLMSVASNYVD